MADRLLKKQIGFTSLKSSEHMIANYIDEEYMKWNLRLVHEVKSSREKQSYISRITGK
jgi:hypothetical protein